ncbi:hypothetical protein BX600DRAFT_472407 [Xylariales sp. PMI_506]|nr:hypothetical protein BX600DRAFT_472407 [Xylariales sp. PMI_506]
MASGSVANINPALPAFLAEHPTIRLITPDTADWDAVRKCFLIRPAVPSAITRPQSSDDVSALVRFCIANNVDFNIRTGGHDCDGRTQVAGALVIDMRDINYVHVDEGKATARVGGGVLLGGLAAALGEHGLITSSGTVASVGYVGWATLGGYGPLSTLYGPGVDQIVGAKLVNAKGDIVDASQELLKGIRGGGGAFGVIVELTIKVYPLKELLFSTIIYESSDLTATWSSYASGYNKLLEEDPLPPALQVQPFIMDVPNLGKSLGLIATWASPDHEEGRRWFDKLAALGTCIVNMAQAATLTKFVEDNEKLMVYGAYGRSYTANLKALTPRSVEILAKYSASSPAGGMISLHGLRDPKPNADSVFGSRVNHHMVEIVVITPDPELVGQNTAWGAALAKELREGDPENVLDSVYISISGEGDATLENIYGEFYDELVELKRKYDPENVFKHAVPKIPL